MNVRFPLPEQLPSLLRTEDAITYAFVWGMVTAAVAGAAVYFYTAKGRN